MAIPGTEFSVGGLELKVNFSPFTTFSLKNLSHFNFFQFHFHFSSHLFAKPFLSNLIHFHFFSFETTGVAISSSTTSRLAWLSSPLGFSSSFPPPHILQGKKLITFEWKHLQWNDFQLLLCWFLSKVTKVNGCSTFYPEKNSEQPSLCQKTTLRFQNIFLKKKQLLCFRTFFRKKNSYVSEHFSKKKQLLCFRTVFRKKQLLCFRTVLLVSGFLLLINIFDGVVNNTPNTNDGSKKSKP